MKILGFLYLGLEHFATLSNGEEIANPRFFKLGEKALAKTQRKLALLKKGTPERRKQGKAIAKIHERISNRRKDFCHKESKKIIEQYQYICVEDLNIKKMVEGSHLAKSITDASWNQFRQFLISKYQL
jgi:putative transposase